MGSDGGPRYVHADRYEELAEQYRLLGQRTNTHMADLRARIAELEEQVAEHHARLCNLGEAVDRICAVQRDQVRA